MGAYYVYVFTDPRNDLPFYVGKGVGHRWRKHLGTACPVALVGDRIAAIRADGFEPVSLVLPQPDERAALAAERQLIAIFGRLDRGAGPLVNRTSGGQGAVARVGFRHTEETKARISASLRQVVPTKAAVENRRAAAKGRTFSPLARERYAEYARSPKGRASLKERGKAAHTPEHQAEMTRRAAEITRGMPKSAEHRKKIGEAQKGRVFSAETLAKMSAAQTRRYAK